MNVLESLHHPEKYFRVLFKWGTLGVLIGLLGGLLGAAFHFCLHFVTQIRREAPWVLYLLPLGGLMTIGLYRVTGLRNNRGTNEIISAVLKGETVRSAIGPVIFLATAITHFFGGSAGREGAALQIGASAASALGKVVHLKEAEKKLLVMSGMSAVFAGLFGTPLTATIFTMEFASVGTIFSPALLPCFLSAYTAATLSASFGVLPETVVLTQEIATSGILWLQLLGLGIGVGVLGIGMCLLFHQTEHFAKKLIKNDWLRILAGSGLLILMTVLAGNQRYNGAGMEMALLAVDGQAQWYDFLRKMVFTAVTLAAGFKGGEIVPTFCVGATFGCVFGALLGLDPGFAAALSLVALFCSVTNSPIAALFLSVEMFGSRYIYPFALVCVVVFVISGNWGLYTSQEIRFSRARFVKKSH